MKTSSITVVILTYNEEANLGRTLTALGWAERVIVLDSRSTDGTAVIAKSFSNVSWLERAFDNHTAQWNHGLDAADTEWVLSLDADYVLPDAFAEELASLETNAQINAYDARFSYWVAGRPLRGTLYPPRAVLFRKAHCRYEPDGHTQRLRIEGSTAELRSVIAHDDRKPLSHWLTAQDKYARLEVEKLLQKGGGTTSMADRLRKTMILAPVTVLIYTLLFKGLILDGWRGWFYVWQRVLAEILLSLRLLERKLAGGANSRSDGR